MIGDALSTFSDLNKYILNGAVLGYGSTEGGKMISSQNKNEPSSEKFYLGYYDESYNWVTGISKLDEVNLKNLGLDYIKMDKQSNIDNKLKEITKLEETNMDDEQIIKAYQDIYYIFAIPLGILLIIDYILKRKKLYY